MVLQAVSGLPPPPGARWGARSLEGRWGGLRLGDIVCPTARSRRMLVTDLDLDDPRAVTCAWQEGAHGLQYEHIFRTSGLVLVRRAARP